MLRVRFESARSVASPLLLRGHRRLSPTRKELAATAVLAMPLAEASVKIRTGPASDEPEDYDLDVWAGVLPARLVFGPPEPDAQLPPRTPVPEHIRQRSVRAADR